MTTFDDAYRAAFARDKDLLHEAARLRVAMRLPSRVHALSLARRLLHAGQQFDVELDRVARRWGLYRRNHDANTTLILYSSKAQP